MKVAIVALCILLAGCVQTAPTAPHHGGDGHHHGGAGEGDGNLPLSGNEDILLNVTGGEPSEFRFFPDAIEVQAGQSVGIRFSNVGDAAHELSIEDIEFHLHAESGQSESGSFIAPEPGEYVIGCYIPGHFEAGMKGTLVVT